MENVEFKRVLGQLIYQLRKERKISQDWSWIENRWTLVSDAGEQHFTLAHRLYSAAELKQLLNESGFVDVRAYGDLDKSLYDEHARRLVVVGEK